MINYKCVIAYDGRRYKGFRKTKNNAKQSIQGILENVLEKKYGEPVSIISAINTDAGVSAKKQVINFKVPDNEINDPLEIHEYFEMYLPEDIIILSVEEVDDRFHSRYNIESITYEYRLWKKDCIVRPLFERHYVNRMSSELNVKTMKKALNEFIGEHDFAGFSTKSKTNSSTKEIFNLDLEETENEIIITIEADGFLLNMERIIVGTLIQIGLGEREINSIGKVFKTKNRADAGHKSMAHALMLKNVKY